MNRWIAQGRSFARPGVAGTTSVEFAVVVVVFLTLVLGIVDFARILWSWNMAAAATAAGARAAAVNDLAARSLRAFDGLAAANPGTPVAVEAVAPNPVVCTTAGCGPAPEALDAAALDPAAFARITAVMRAIHPGLTAANVVVEYRHVGLGLAGNPDGPDIDPVVTVRLRDVRVRFLALRFLALPDISLPDFRAAMTVEDGRST